MRESMNEEALNRARQEAEAHARQQLEVGCAGFVACCTLLPAVCLRCCCPRLLAAGCVPRWLTSKGLGWR